MRGFCYGIVCCCCELCLIDECWFSDLIGILFDGINFLCVLLCFEILVSLLESFNIDLIKNLFC